MQETEDTKRRQLGWVGALATTSRREDDATAQLASRSLRQLPKPQHIVSFLKPTDVLK